MQYTREGREVTYIHYMKPGDYAFRHDLFCKLTNDGNWVKPKGGLWASPVDAVLGWKDWCEGEGFRECNEAESFKFTVRDPKRIFYIDSKESYDEFCEKYVTRSPGSFTRWQRPAFNCGMDKIDFEKMVEDGWDGLEISISDYAQLYNYLYGWDCDSIVVFNKEAIVLC